MANYLGLINCLRGLKTVRPSSEGKKKSNLRIVLQRGRETWKKERRETIKERDLWEQERPELVIVRV